jgi:hypothetical protein
MKAYRGSTGMAPLILNPATGWSLVPIPGKNPGMGTRDHQEALEMKEIACFYLDSNPGPSIP